MIYQAHSLLRYLVLLAGLAVLAYALFGLSGRRPYSPRMRSLSSMFNGIMLTEVLLGSMLIVSARFRGPGLIPHILLTLSATGVALLSSRAVLKRPPGERGYLLHVLGIGGALALVVGGVLALGYSLL